MFNDRFQGRQSHKLASESGDFIVRRRDGLMAYQLAVVVDDAAQGVTDIVRGIDLIESTPRQIWLQRLLDYGEPSYAHIPIAVNSYGQKLSKGHGAGAVPHENPAVTLILALDALGQKTPKELRNASLKEVWAWALAHWKPAELCDKQEISVGNLFSGAGRQDHAVDRDEPTIP